MYVLCVCNVCSGSACPAICRSRVVYVMWMYLPSAMYLYVLLRHVCVVCACKVMNVEVACRECM